MPELRLDHRHKNTAEGREALAVVQELETQGFITVRTSGSTGEPKEIKLSKDFIVASTQRTFTHLNLPEKGTVLCSLPLHYVAGMMQVFRAYFWEYNLTFSATSLTPLNDWIPEDISLATFTPIQWENILDNCPEKIVHLKHVIIGGGKMSNALMDKSQRFKGVLWASYGMTETASHIALQQVVPQRESAFHTLEGVEVSTSHEGCLVVHLDNEKYLTRDIVRLYSKQTFEVLGRLDNVINSGGYKIQAEKLEEDLSWQLNCSVVVVPVPDDKFGQRPVAVLDRKVEQQELIEVFSKLDSKEKPVASYFIHEFPRLRSSKLDRQAIINQLPQLEKLY